MAHLIENTIGHQRAGLSWRWAYLGAQIEARRRVTSAIRSPARSSQLRLSNATYSEHKSRKHITLEWTTHVQSNVKHRSDRLILPRWEVESLRHQRCFLLEWHRARCDSRFDGSLRDARLCPLNDWWWWSPRSRSRRTRGRRRRCNRSRTRAGSGRCRSLKLRKALQANLNGVQAQ